MKISIFTYKGSKAVCGELHYVVCELKHFLNEYTTAAVIENGNEYDAAVELCIDENLQPHCYNLDGDGAVLRIRGGNASSVLCGVYEALADAGINFEAVGYSLPDQFDMNVFFHDRKEVRPKCRLRGIRQHINFPMDISSYTLKDAREYIRSIARMRFNAITFHSYGGQWHSTMPDDPECKAGHFFYGQRHPVTDADPLTAGRINNRRVYCIPEAETIYDDPAAIDEYARYWLGEVMDTAKEAEMTITLSVEIPFDDEESISSMLHEVCRTYPQIDVIELISYESGSCANIENLTLENVTDIMVDMFGREILDRNGRLPGLLDNLPKQLGGAAVSLKRILTAISVQEKWMNGLKKVPMLRAGLYITCSDTLRILIPIMRKLLPSGMSRSLLPAHGALTVANVIESIGINETDWQDTMFYTWAEFDGNMYIQQLSTEGIEKLISISAAESIYGFCINHWRTSENRIAISYAAQAAITPVSTTSFYEEYARKTGIKDTAGFVDACDRLAKLDTFCREKLFNIGFCFVRCWFRKGEIVRPRGYSVEAQECAIKKYERIGGAFKKILDSAATREAIELVRLMINRCITSSLHIKAMLVLEDIHKFYDYSNPAKLTQKQREAVKAVTDKAHQYAQEYIHLYGEMLPDRGCEGLIVSYCETTPVFIDALAAYVTGSTNVLENDTFDAPPSPDDDI